MSSGEKASGGKKLSPLQREFDVLLKKDPTAAWQWLQFNVQRFVVQWTPDELRPAAVSKTSAKQTKTKRKRPKPAEAKKKVEKAPKKPVESARGSLHNRVMGILKRTPSKEDLVYKLESDTAPYVASVILSEAVAAANEDGDAASPLTFTGTSSTEKKDAMESAAVAALQALQP